MIVDPADGTPAWVEAALEPAFAAALAASPDACAAALRVYTAVAADEGSPPLLGSHACDAGHARFTPRLPWVPGLAYHAVLDLRAWGGLRSQATFVAPDHRGAPRTRVLRVTPSGPEVPENLLKLYVHFSAPIRRGTARLHVSWIDAESGAAVAAPFAEGGAELWDPDHTRLTLLLDPGRIKQGLRGEAEQGPPLRAGRRYRLLIASELRDLAGLPLREPFAQEWTIGAADHAPPDPSTWTLQSPRAGSREPLVVRFPEALDAALLEHALAVEGPGLRVAGVVAIEPGERGWRFTPDADWRPVAHELTIDPRLEDLAGNNLRRAFDRDLAAQPQAPALPPPARLAFTPRP